MCFPQVPIPRTSRRGTPVAQHARLNGAEARIALGGMHTAVTCIQLATSGTLSPQLTQLVVGTM